MDTSTVVNVGLARGRGGAGHRHRRRPDGPRRAAHPADPATASARAGLRAGATWTGSSSASAPARSPGCGSASSPPRSWPPSPGSDCTGSAAWTCSRLSSRRPGRRDRLRGGHRRPPAGGLLGRVRRRRPPPGRAPVSPPRDVPRRPTVGPAADLYPDQLVGVAGPRTLDPGVLATPARPLPDAGRAAALPAPAGRHRADPAQVGAADRDPRRPAMMPAAADR